MHRPLIAVAVAFTAAVLPACAQRGGAHSASFGHGAPGFHSGFSAPVRSGGFATPQFSSTRSFGANPNQRFPSRVSGPIYPVRRPDGDRNNRFRGAYRPVYGLGLPYTVGYIGDGFLDDPGLYDQPAYADDQPEPQPPDYAGAPYPPPPIDQAAAAPIYRPAYQQQQPAADPPPQQAVTLIFKDGRPNEQIQNYLLTRTTLYIQDQRLRQVPVSQLDLDSMSKVNGDAGVEFNLPKPIP
jgi:hypothetical protein